VDRRILSRVQGRSKFELRRGSDDSTDFSMDERFSGLMLPLLKRLLLDFKPVFESYAGDLKREAERTGA
jgi:hypothetical protein